MWGFLEYLYGSIIILEVLVPDVARVQVWLYHPLLLEVLVPDVARVQVLHYTAVSSMDFLVAKR